MNKTFVITNNRINKYLLFLLLSFLFLTIETKISFAGNDNSYVTTEKSEGVFTVSESGNSSPIFISSDDYPGVNIVAKLLQTDINNVTDAKPILTVITSGTEKMPQGKEIIVAGTIGKSEIINKLVKDKKLNVDNITGKWETFLTTVIQNPFPSVDRALVIAGSDKRGTIYGMFDLSEKIGVSPWYWWADVPVKKKDAVYILPGTYSNGEPKVKYRGIFLNDEAPALTGWAHEKFGGLNHKFYVHVFELILRLKGNFLWPAMWGNNFDDDDSLNQKLADEYGVVMGTSHHEPMMRSWKEWQKYGHGDWNYQTNDSTLREYWRKGIERMNSYESIVTLGMRGNGDEAMSEGANIGLLERIISDQRKILAEVTGKDVTTIPQVWALYKEVQEYYDKGMRVPNDVTLLLCDDNWGNIRKLPKLNAKPRKGGYGIYYHFDYVGGPRNYKWLNTNQIERTWEQMHLAYEYGVKRIWIVNVGDLKPMEFPISFFLDYAWNPDKYSAKDLPEYYKSWAKEQFGSEHINEIAHILARYTKYNSRRKPELLSPETYSLINYCEAKTVVKDYNQLAEEAQQIYDSLPEEYKAAFYQLILYPVEACANLNELYVTAAINYLYAKQGRVETNDLAIKVKDLFDKDAELSHYYNKVMANGKWDHMMDQTHIGYTYWQQPEQNNMPEVKETDINTNAKMGVAIEGSEKWFPENKDDLTLPVFDKFNKQKYYIEIFNQGKTPFVYSIQTGEPWVMVNRTKGKIKTQERLWLSVDWEKAAEGENFVPVTITGTEGSKVVVQTIINNPSSPAADIENCFVESNGYISIEAPHFTNTVYDGNISWLVIPNLGRTLSAVTPVPVTSSEQTPGDDDPHLEYQVYLFDKGEVKVDAYLSPTLNFHNTSNGIRYAVSFDDEKPQIINMTSNPNPPDLNHDPVWNRWVANNINIQESKHKINKPGIHTLKFWMVDPGVDLQKIVIDCGGVKPSYLGPPESFNHTVN